MIVKPIVAEQLGTIRIVQHRHARDVSDRGSAREPMNGGLNRVVAERDDLGRAVVLAQNGRRGREVDDSDAVRFA